MDLIRDLLLLGRAQPVIPPNLYDVNEHNSLGSPGKISCYGAYIHEQDTNIQDRRRVSLGARLDRL